MNDIDLLQLKGKINLLEKKIDLLFENLIPLYAGHTQQDTFRKLWEELTVKELKEKRSKIDEWTHLQTELGDENRLIELEEEGD